MDVNFFIISYRGFGLSGGSPHQAGIQSDSQVGP